MHVLPRVYCLIIIALSGSIGRAFALNAGCHRFTSSSYQRLLKMVLVACSNFYHFLDSIRNCIFQTSKFVGTVFFRKLFFCASFYPSLFSNPDSHGLFFGVTNCYTPNCNAIHLSNNLFLVEISKRYVGCAENGKHTQYRFI